MDWIEIDDHDVQTDWPEGPENLGYKIKTGDK